MANVNIINYFLHFGHIVYLYELTHPLYAEPRYVFIDEILTPKEKDDVYDFEFNMIYISKVYDNKEEAESKFSNLKCAYLFNAHAMFPDDCKDMPDIRIRSDVYEKYMDSIIDKIVIITSICVSNKSNLNDFESGFSIDLNLKFKINGIKFTAEAYTVYGDCTDGRDPNVNIIIYKDKNIVAFVDDTFSLCNDHGEKSIIKSNNDIDATDIGGSESIHKSYSIIENLNINLTSLGRFLVNRVYQEINDIISKVDQA